MSDERQLISHARLMLNIQMPTLEDCWQEGFDSFHNEIDDANNPYKADTPEYHHWQEGWWAACYDESPAHSIESVRETSPSISTQTAANDAIETAVEPRRKVANSSFRRLFRNAVGIGTAILLAMLCYQIADVAT